EQISSEMWEELNALYLSIRDVDADRLWKGEPHRFLRDIQRSVRLLNGVADSTLDHDEGWQFVRLGRFMERAVLTGWLLDAHFGVRGAMLDGEPTPQDFAIWTGLLRTCSAFEAYCRRHTIRVRPDLILEFLLLDGDFPHSVRFAAAQLADAVTAIGEWTGTPRNAEPQRLGNRLL